MNEKYYCVIDTQGFYKDLVMAFDVQGPGKLVLDLGEIGAADMTPSSWEEVSSIMPEKELSELDACKTISNSPYIGRTEDDRVFCYASSVDGETAALLIIDPEHDAVFSFVGPLLRNDNEITLKNADTDTSIKFTLEWRDGEMVEEIQGYKLAEGESLVLRTDECRQPARKFSPGSPGFVRPKWDGAAWVEGATAEEIAAWEVEHPAPEPVTIPPTTEDLAEENKLLRAQLAATSARQEFLEDCMSEMAGQIYNV